MPAESPLSQDLLDDLWDFNDPVASERRFAAAQADADPLARAELVTQQARALGLQGRFDDAAALLDAVPVSTPVLEVRVLLERGRLHNSAGNPAAARPLFARAADRAQRAELFFLAVDALHMQAIVEPANGAHFTKQALKLVKKSRDRRTERWAVSLHNNLGWTLHDEDRFRDALGEFQAAHRASQQVGTPRQEFLARWAIARCLRSMRRYDEALALQEQLFSEDPDDQYVLEEIAALRRALKRPS